MAVIWPVAATAAFAAGRITVSWVPLTKVVVSAAVFQETAVDGTNPEPLTVSVVSDELASTLAGAIVVATGTGLFTEICAAEDAPPPGEGLTTVTFAMDPSARSPAWTVALKTLTDTYVVASATPFHWATEPGIKPVPWMLRTVSVEPAVSEPGVKDVIAGTGFGAGGDGEDPDPPPQPVNTPTQQNTKATNARLARVIRSTQLSSY
jgi:hypothetical protein